MSTLTIRIDDEIKEKLEKYAKKLSISKGAIIRIAIKDFLLKKTEPEQEDTGFDYEKIKHLIGSIDSGIDDLGSNHEEHLREIFIRK
ncbi:MAG: ribbon-helix-helix protein, CopG family [bacterium]